MTTVGFANAGGDLAGDRGGFVRLERLIAEPPGLSPRHDAGDRARRSGRSPSRPPGTCRPLSRREAHPPAGTADRLRRPVAARGARLAVVGSAARHGRTMIGFDHLWMLAAGPGRRRAGRRSGFHLAEGSASGRADRPADRLARPDAQSFAPQPAPVAGSPAPSRSCSSSCSSPPRSVSASNMALPVSLMAGSARF